MSEQYTISTSDIVTLLLEKHLEELEKKRIENWKKADTLRKKSIELIETAYKKLYRKAYIRSASIYEALFQAYALAGGSLFKVFPSLEDAKKAFPDLMERYPLDSYSLRNYSDVCDISPIIVMVAKDSYYDEDEYEEEDVYEPLAQLVRAVDVLPHGVGNKKFFTFRTPKEVKSMIEEVQSLEKEIYSLNHALRKPDEKEIEAIRQKISARVTAKLMQGAGFTVEMKSLWDSISSPLLLSEL